MFSFLIDEKKDFSAYNKELIFFSRTAILLSASASFLRSISTTFCGAFDTNLSLFNLPCTLLRNPFVYERSSFNFFFSKSRSISSPNGIKNSLESIRKECDLGIFLSMYSSLVRFPIFIITESNETSISSFAMICSSSLTLVEIYCRLWWTVYFV